MADSRLRIILELTDRASAGIKKAANSLRDMEKKTADARKVFEHLRNVMGGMAAAGLVVKKALDFAEEGAQFLRLRDTSSIVARSMGADMGDIVDSIQNASLGTISEMDAMQAASRAMALGLGADSEKLANLMEVAAFRGRQMGLSTTQAFNDIVTGIGRMSPLILDNLGIMVDANTTFTDYAASIGKTSNELTGMEKRQALLNRVLEEGNSQLEAAGGLTLDHAAKLERLNAFLKDTEVGFKVFLAEGLVPYLDIATAVPDVLRVLNERFGELPFIASVATEELQKLGMSTEQLAEIDATVIDGWAASLLHAADAAGAAAEQTATLVVSTSELTSAQLGREAMDNLNTALQEGRISQDEYDAAARTVMVTLLDMSQEQISANFALRALNQSFDEGTTSTTKYISEIQRLNNTLNELILTQEEASMFSGPTVAGGFQHGGSFIVGGQGGADSQMVAFRASPGERVTVSPQTTNNMNLTIQSNADSEDLVGQFAMMKAIVGGAH